MEKGRLKNAQYLIRGAVTDFTVVGDVSGWFGVQDKATIRGRGERARVALVIQSTWPAAKSSRPCRLRATPPRAAWVWVSITAS